MHTGAGLGGRQQGRGGKQLACAAIARWMRLREGIEAITDCTSARVAGGGGGGFCGGGEGGGGGGELGGGGGVCGRPVGMVGG